MAGGSLVIGILAGGYSATSQCLSAVEVDVANLHETILRVPIQLAIGATLQRAGYRHLSGEASLGYGLWEGKIQSWDLLMGAAPAMSGIAAGKVASMAGAGSGIQLLTSIATGLSVATYLSYLENKQRQAIVEELGENRN